MDNQKRLKYLKLLLGRKSVNNIWVQQEITELEKGVK